MERRREGLQRALIRTLPLDRRMTRIEPTAMPSKAPNKLIEVALPLDDINAAAARTISTGQGDPSTGPDLCRRRGEAGGL